MRTVFGPLVDRLGLGLTAERHAHAIPCSGLRTIQPQRIPVEQGHGGDVIGETAHIHRTSRCAWLVAHIRDDIAPMLNVRVGDRRVQVETPVFWSGEFDSNMSGTDTIIRTVALTMAPGQTCLEPLRWLDGSLDFRQVAAERWHLKGFELELMERAAASFLDRRKHGGPIVVHDDGRPAGPGPVTPYQRNSGTTIEIRSANVAAISESRREITALVAPYQRETASVMINGRPCREVFAVGCFDRDVEQGNTVRLNMNHRRERVVGKAVEWLTGRSDGLVGTFRIARTVAGDEALELAADDCVDCSVGFGIVRESWPQRDLHLVHEGFIDHVALTSDPAYRDAKVLGVRDTQLASV